MKQPGTRSSHQRADGTQAGQAQVNRLCWTRRELARATGLSYRTIVNLEARGLLTRVALGINLVLYTDESVRALLRTGVVLGEKADSQPSNT